MSVVQFGEARAEAFARELKRLAAVCESRWHKISRWPEIWFDSPADQAIAIDLAQRIIVKQQLEGSIAAAKRYGADPTSYEAELQSLGFDDTQTMWDEVNRLITCSRVEC